MSANNNLINKATSTFPVYDVIERSIHLDFLESLEGAYLMKYGSNVFHLPNKYIFKHLQIQKLVRSIMNECAVTQEVDLKIFYDPTTPAAADRKNILLNPFFYLDWNALPDSLSISGIDDPKLQDRKFYKDFFKYLAEEFDYSFQEIDFQDIYGLLFFIHLKSDPEGFYMAMRTMIAHELGHIEHEDYAKSSALRKEFEDFSENWSTFSKVMHPFIDLTKSVWHILAQKKKEEAADSFAAHNLKEATSGAKYGFGCAKKAIESLKNCSALTLNEKIIVGVTMPFNEGSIMQLLTHGSLSGRVDHIQHIRDNS